MSVKIIAYYLPQFHPTKENDLWWGKGFTEWTNVTKAKPLFKGHLQPKLPTDLGFYDLRVPEVRNEQAQLAKENGIDGFCYWHYWFGNGEKLLDFPINEVLKSKSPDFPFCFAWANQTWGGLPYGDGFDRILIEQKYLGRDDYKAHFNHVLQFFKDKRYIKINNKPVFQVNSPLGIPDSKDFIDLWNSLAIENGFDGVFFIAHGMPDFDYEKYGFNALNFTTPLHLFTRYKQPFYNRLLKKMSGKTFQQIRNKIFGSKPTIYNYKKIVKASEYDDLDKNKFFIPVAIPNWDHTPRSKKKGNVIVKITPKLFLQNLRNCFKLIEHRNDDEKFIFVKSWNEWAEGNYLEPDKEFGKLLLNTVKEFKSEL